MAPATPSPPTPLATPSPPRTSPRPSTRPRASPQREGFSILPPPLRGRARVGGGSQTPWRTVVRTPRAAPRDPPPQPSPARGEGVLMSLSRCEFRQLGKKAPHSEGGIPPKPPSAIPSTGPTSSHPQHRHAHRG